MNELLSARRVKQQFGRKSQVAKHTLPTIYETLAEDPALKLAKSPKSSVDWKRYGQQYDIENSSPEILLGALHVYYAGVALWLAAEHIAQQSLHSYQWSDVVSGQFFQEVGIYNLAAPDWMQTALLAVDTAHFPQFDVPGMPGDVLKHFYQDLIPKKVRHAQGAYYTPDWLADHLLAQVGYDGQQTLLDPACGSGTFLVAAVQSATKQGLHPNDILSGMYGIDNDPLAILAAKVNLLLNLAPCNRPITLPIYEADALFNDLGLAQVDLVVGNPPWINWQHLSAAYRTQTRELWDEYGLFAHQGMDQILGKGKKDFATLFTCVVADRYLKDGGQLAFLLSRSTLKSGGASAGFRRYLMTGALTVSHVDDVSQITSYGGTRLDTIALFAAKTSEQKVRPTISYSLWRPQRQRLRLEDEPLKRVLALTTRHILQAEPIAARDPRSPWLSAPQAGMAAIRKLTGASAYEAHAGVYTGGANAAYWLDILEDRGKTLLVKNIRENSKRAMKTVTAEIECDLVYPLLRGRDVQRWCAQPSAHILMVQDPQRRRGYDETWLQQVYPRVYDYLLTFKPTLLKRGAYKRYFRDDAPFYTMFDVAAYSFAPYKVVWQGIGARSMQAAVCSPSQGKPVMTNQAMHPFVGLEDEDEAHYLAACLNSLPFEYALLTHSQAGSQSFAQAGILKRLRIPAFHRDNSLHRELTTFSQDAHNGDIGDDLAEISAALWGITATELEAMRQNIAIWQK